MKTALVHEWLINIAGSEKVLESIYNLFPSPIYTLVKNKDNLEKTAFGNATIITSFIQSLPNASKAYKTYLPLFPLAIEQFNLSEYDVIISSSHAVAKGTLTRSDQLHICYCHTPIRYAWDLYHLYLKKSGLSKGLRGVLAKLILHYIRMWDVATAHRVDYFIANSKYTAKRIKKIYNRESTVIYPPVDIDRFQLCSKKEDFYVMVSRMTPYKNVDLIVDAFSHMPEKRLVVIGEGTDCKKIKVIAGKNVELLGHCSFDIMKQYMEKAKAFVFGAEEDFGISLVEAQACGTPVITYGKGGALESVVESKTGLFFEEQTNKSIIETVEKFEKIQDSFDYSVIRKNAEKFNIDCFKNEFKKFVDLKIDTFFKSQT